MAGKSKASTAASSERSALSNEIGNFMSFVFGEY
jgi:hypothetical protein